MIRVLFKGVITWKSVIRKFLFVAISYPTIMLPLSYFIICRELKKLFLILHEILENTTKQLTYSKILYSYKIEICEQIESVRLFYVLLKKATNEFNFLYDFPLAIYFLLFLLEAFYYCYLVTVLDEVLHYYHLFRFLYNCCVIHYITSATDDLKNSVSNVGTYY